MKKIGINLATALLIFVGLLLVWQGVIWLFTIQPYLLPSPLRVARAVIANFSSLMTSLGITAVAAAGGLAASLVVGILIALLFAQSPWVRRMFYPYTILLQTVPIVAVAPLILMWVGAGIWSVMLVTFIICLAPIIANTTQGDRKSVV